jgi:NitT/TauT family transport system permease protein
MAILELNRGRPVDSREPPEAAAGRWDRWRLWLLPISGLAALAFWEGLIRLAGYPAFILPPPGRVWSRALVAIADGTLWRHAGVTLSEVLPGLALGLGVAWGLGYLLAKSPALERLLSPYIVASQAVPIVAVAPLIVIWFGAETLSKVLICALIVFFPVLINTVVGIRSVEPELRELMRSLKATRWQTFVKLEVPASLPVLLGGLKVGATLSVIGGVIGEFVGADSGLGFLINVGNGLYDTPLIFVAVFALVAIALSLYGIVAVLEKWLVK